MSQKSYLKIPRARVGALIGPNGSDKRMIENMLGVSLEIESDSGSVEITLNRDNRDPTSIFTVQNIVKAVGRGFNPKKAMSLIQEDYNLHIIDLTEFVGESKNALARVKGRIIGRGGRSRELIEALTETQISVYGDTISYIGTPENLEAAREAIMMLIKGSFHKTVWNYLYAWRRKMKKDKGELWFESPQPKMELRKK